MQKVKFLTGFGGFGGSTIALIEHCRLLESLGYEVSMYSSDEWCLTKYDKAFPMDQFEAHSDDILVYHYMDIAERPNCKKCYLYVHERSLWDMSIRPSNHFDRVLFVSKSQKNWHGIDGFVMPNPMGKLVSEANHRPPGMGIAGVVGTVQPRKRQHVSIEASLRDGMNQVLVFGNYVEPYFSDFIVPMLSGEKVKYMGHYEPERRMEMYNSFDVLYNFSEDESACLVIGECKLLNKPIVKSEMIFDYEVKSEEFVAESWRRLFDER